MNASYMSVTFFKKDKKIMVSLHQGKNTIIAVL